MTFLRIFKHLLPNARAWRVTVDKRLRQFFAGLSGVGEDVKTFFDGIWLDIFPQTTRELDTWEQQFALPDTGLTEQQRRDRLAATWKTLGGQDPRYIQDTLRGAGFDVYVHEWWDPINDPTPGVKECVTPRNPFSVLSSPEIERFFNATAGNPAVTCGNPIATCGSSTNPVGYPLVNKVFTSRPNYRVTCGNPAATCGAPAATCGNYVDFKDVQLPYFIPTDIDKWRYFLYIGGPNFGDVARIDPRRKDEFEELCLKICPAQQWIGVIAEYN